MGKSEISYHGTILIGNNIRKMSPILVPFAVLLVILCTQLEISNAAVLNRTDQYYILSVPVKEFENLRQARQQQNTTQSSTPSSAPIILSSVFAGVNEILRGVFNEVPITGTSGLAPVGVSGLLQTLSPAIQSILFGLNPNRTSAVQPAAETDAPLPPNIRVIIELDSDTEVNPTVTPTIPPTTTPIPTTTPEPETIIINYRVGNRNRTKATTTTPTPARVSEPLISIKEVGPGQVLLYFRHPHETYNGSPQVSNPQVPQVSNSEIKLSPVPNSESRFPQVPNSEARPRPPQVPIVGSRFPQSSSLPESSNINPHLPDSPRAGIAHNIGDINAYLPEFPTVAHAIRNKVEIKNIIEAPAAQYLKEVPSLAQTIRKIIEAPSPQYLKVMEEEPIPIPATTTEKEYVYLVLQESEYEKFIKYTNQNRIPTTSRPQPPSYEAVVVSREHDQPQQQQQHRPQRQEQLELNQLQRQQEQLQLQQLQIRQDQLQLQLHQLQQTPTVGSIVVGTPSPPTPSTSSTTLDPADPSKPSVDEDDDDEDERIAVSDVLAAVLTER